MRSAAWVLLSLLATTTPGVGQSAAVGTTVVAVSDTPVRTLLRGVEGRLPGQPVFVLQTGAGSRIEAWGDLPDSLSTMAPVVAYDRPGLGASEFNNVDPAPTQVAHHLRLLLQELEVAPPYVLVGHSWGGPLILYFTGLFPDEVAGLLYLDPSHPERTWEAFFMTDDPELYAEREAEMHAFRTDSLEWSPGRRAESRVISSYWASSIDSRSLPEPPSVATTIVLGTRFEPTGVAFMDRAFMEDFHRSREERFRVWTAQVPDLELLVLPSAGHFVHLYDVGAVTSAARSLLSRIH